MKFWPHCRRPSDGVWWWGTWRQPPSWCWLSSQTVCQPAEGCSHSSHSCTESSLGGERVGGGVNGWANMVLRQSMHSTSEEAHKFAVMWLPHFLFSVPFHNTTLNTIDKMLEGNGMLVSQSSGKQRLSGLTNSSRKLRYRNMWQTFWKWMVSSSWPLIHQMREIRKYGWNKFHFYQKFRGGDNKSENFFRKWTVN